MTARVMSDVVKPPGRDVLPRNADRIGECAREFFDQRLEERLTSAGQAFLRHADMSMPIDLTEAAEMLITSVQWRLFRLEALLRLLQADRHDRNDRSLHQRGKETGGRVSPMAHLAAGSE